MRLVMFYIFIIGNPQGDQNQQCVRLSLYYPASLSCL